MGMFYLLVEGREYFTDDMEQLERILYERYSGGHAASTRFNTEKSGAWQKAEVFRATTLLFRAFGNREFVALEVGEYIKRLAAFGPSEESIQGEGACPRTPGTLGYSLTRPQSP
jgi:hypothetical protein